MNLIKTNHADQRIHQRGIPQVVLGIVEECGRLERAVGGVDKIYMGSRDIKNLRNKLKKVIQVLDKASGVIMVIDGDVLITTYKCKG